jgi:hypothetical protein
MSFTPTDHLFPPLQEPERFFRQRLKQRTRVVSQAILNDQPIANERTISDYLRPTIGSFGAPITRPTVEANNFKIRHLLIQLLQNSATFHGLADEDAHLHIFNYLEICDTFKINGNVSLLT